MRALGFRSASLMAAAFGRRLSFCGNKKAPAEADARPCFTALAHRRRGRAGRALALAEEPAPVPSGRAACSRPCGRDRCSPGSALVAVLVGFSLDDSRGARPRFEHDERFLLMVLSFGNSLLEFPPQLNVGRLRRVARKRSALELRHGGHQ